MTARPAHPPSSPGAVRASSEQQGRVLFQPLGDSAVMLSWPECAEDRIGDVVRDVTNVLSPLVTNRSDAQTSSPAFCGVVPAFASVTVHYSPLLLTWDEVVSQLQHVLQDSSAKVMNSARVVEIPVCYGAQFANDLAHVAAAHGMTTDDVIRLHSGAEYTVRMIGFSPGFPYLAGLPNELITPRLKTPRLKVPSGSVAIGGRQTGIYSLETPGGWNIIGRTPVEMFRPDQHPPCFLNAGDQVRFVAISAEEFHERQEHGS